MYEVKLHGETVAEFERFEQAELYTIGCTDVFEIWKNGIRLA